MGIKKFAWLLILIIFSNCETNYVRLSNYLQKEKIFREVQKNYKIGDTLEVAPGELMLDLYLVENHTTIVYEALDNSFKLDSNMNLSDTIIKKESIWYPKYSTDSGLVVQGDNNNFGIEIDSTGNIVRGYGTYYQDSYGDYSNNKFTFPTTYKFSCNKLFVTTEITEKHRSNHSHKFYYTGRSANSIKIAYREFIEQEESQDVYNFDYEFNIDEKEFKIRTLRIKIISATNFVLKFVVISDEGLLWVN